MHHEWSTSIGVNLKSLENIVATLQTDVKPTLLPSLPCLQEIPDENLSDWEPPIFETKTHRCSRQVSHHQYGDRAVKELFHASG
jgi:hypothetical protein